MQARTHSGLRIHYDDRGEGEPALLLLPGWCVNRSVYRRLAPILSRWRRVLSLDWRGHGDSDTPRAEFGTTALAADARAVVEASGASSVVPVALAHSGWVALELRRLLGARVPALVLLDWLVLEPPPSFRDALRRLQSADHWLKTREELLAAWQNGSDEVGRYLSEEVRPYAFEMWARAARAIGEAYDAAGSPLRALTGFHPPVPTLHLFASSSDPGFLERQLWFARRQPWFDAQTVVARSHFPMLEAPEPMAGTIEDFVAARAFRTASPREARRWSAALPARSGTSR